MHPVSTHRHFGREVRVAEITPTSTMIMRSGRQVHHFPAGSGTTSQTRALAQQNPHPSRIDIHYETHAGTVGHYGAPNPEPRRALSATTWTAAGTVVGAAIGAQVGRFASSHIPYVQDYASYAGAAVGGLIGGMIGRGISNFSQEYWHAGHLIPNAAGGSGADARNIVGQHPQTNMGHGGLYPLWRGPETQMGRDMRRDGGMHFEAHLHDAYEWP